MKYELYGDGVRDDYPAIQELLDSGASEVVLPAPTKHYLISKTLKIHGGQTLRLGMTARIRLTKMANCSMIEDFDFGTWKENVVVDGGIWDMNHNEQDPNPWHFAGADGKSTHDKLGSSQTNFTAYSQHLTQFPDVYTGFCMRFCRIKRFVLKNVTIVNPVTYGAQLGYVENFLVENIRFDYTEGSPNKWNMDGIHMEGHCKDGILRNLQGACHDDMVALTADDGLYGPIRNILVDGIFADGGHSAVRILSHGLPVENVRICNVYGKFYSKVIGLTKYHGGEDERGVLRNITIDNVVATSCAGTVGCVCPASPRLIWVQKGVDVENLRIEHFRREEEYSSAPLLLIEQGATVKRLRLKDISQKNLTDKKVAFLQIDGEITDGVYEDLQEE